MVRLNVNAPDPVALNVGAPAPVPLSLNAPDAVPLSIRLAPPEPYEEKTVSGALVTVADALPKPAVNLTASIVAAQSGSGDPRPISGWTDVTVWDDPVYGGSVMWNQLVQNGDFSDGATGWASENAGSAITVSSGIATVKHNTGALSPYNPALKPSSVVPGVIGHVFYFGIIAKIPANGKLYFGGNPTDFSGFPMIADTYTEHEKIIKETRITNNGGLFSYIGVTNAQSVLSSGAEIQFKKIQCIDLTAMFGETKADEIYAMEQATAGSGVAYFRSLFPDDYYPYDNTYTKTCVSAVNGDPYTKTVLPLGQTVYGGSLDVTTGVLTVTHAIVDMGTLNWLYSSGTARMYTTEFRSTAKPAASGTEVGDILCEIYKTDTDAHTASHASDKICAIGNTGIIYVYDTDYTVPATFKTAVSGKTLCYALLTPVTVQLTPASLSLLRGTNNVWADTGDITMTYKASISP